MVVVTAAMYVCTSQAIFAVGGCAFVLYPLVAMTMQLMTLLGLVLPASWTVRQSTETARAFITQLVPPKAVMLLLGKLAWNGIGNIHRSVFLGRMFVPEGAFCYTSVHFIVWNRMGSKNDAHSQARASLFKSCVQRSANSIDFRACDFVVFGWENGPFGGGLSPTLGRGTHFEWGGTQEGPINTRDSVFGCVFIAFLI